MGVLMDTIHALSLGQVMGSVILAEAAYVRLILAETAYVRLIFAEAACVCLHLTCIAVGLISGLGAV